MTVRLELPWPPATLSPNGRTHWATKAKAVKAYRATCGFECAIQTRAVVRLDDSDAPLRLVLVFVPPDRRHYDQDNLLARMKAGIDGVCVRLHVNDRRIRETIVSFAEPRKPGAVRLELGPIGEDQ